MIYLDLSAAVHQRAGLGRYAASLARALLPLIPDELRFFYNREQGIQPVAGLEHIPARTVALGYKPWRLLVAAGQALRVPFNALVPDARLFHATEHLLLPLRGIPTLLTVHDLFFRHYPDYHKPLNRWYLNLTLKMYCERATHLIAVSEYTRQDVLRSYGLPPDKVRVIYEAAAPAFHPQTPEAVARVRARYGLPERYILAVSTIEPRKNYTRLLQAFERLHAEGLSEALVIVGRKGWLFEAFFHALELSPARQAVRFPGYVLDDDLPALYAGAQAFAFPSLAEGFGLPLLEAMACGTPSVASNVTSLPEIGGDAAVLVDPLDVEAIYTGLRRVLTDAALREALRERGLRRAAQFSWERAARETLALYREMAGVVG